jgi:hypothetical protein
MPRRIERVFTFSTQGISVTTRGMDAPVERIRLRRTRRTSASSKVLRSLLLSLGLCGLALSVVLIGWGVLVGNRQLVAIGAWYPPASLLVLLLRWVLLQIKQRRTVATRRRRAEHAGRAPVPS